MPDTSTSASQTVSTREEFLQRISALRPRLHRYCARMAGSMLDGEDIVQETFIKATAGYDPHSVQNADAWLFRVAHNAAMDHLRGKAREEAVFDGSIDDDAQGEAADPHARADQRHIARLALGTFMRLPSGPRSAVILADVLDYAVEEAAECMGLSLSAAKAALHRGRAQLRKMNDTGSAPPGDAAAMAPASRLSTADQQLLDAYVERFNARDFDGLRDMLGEHVRLDLIARHKVEGRAQVANYFSNYSRLPPLRASAAVIEGRPALYMHARESDPAALDYVVVFAWSGEDANEDRKLKEIRDFRYAGYGVDSAAQAAR